MIPVLIFYPDQDKSRQESGNERDTQVDENRSGYLPDGDVHLEGLKAEPSWKNRYKNIGIKGKEQDLEYGVEGHQSGCIFGIPLASSFHTITMAMQRASPVRINPAI